MNPIALRVATRNSWLRCHSRIRVAEPMTTTASGSAISRIHKPTCGRAAYQSTMRCAVCAGSYCNGWTLRANSADIKRTAGKTNSSSKAATKRRIVFMGFTLYHKVNPGTSQNFASHGRQEPDRHPYSAPVLTIICSLAVTTSLLEKKKADKFDPKLYSPT